MKRLYFAPADLAAPWRGSRTRQTCQDASDASSRKEANPRNPPAVGLSLCAGGASFLGITLLALTLASLPSFLVIFSQPEGYRYFTLEGHDEFVYLFWMKQAANGHFLFDNSYAIEEHSRLFFHPLFLVLGRLAAVFKIPLPLIFVFARVICGFLLLASAYWAISFFLMSLSGEFSLLLFLLSRAGFLIRPG